jgi:putative oxidoreductase
MIDSRLAPYGALALRVALGLMFIAHGWLKLTVFTVPGFEAYLTGMGLPAIFAWPIIAGELVGGIAILLGIYARAVAVLLLPILLGAFAIHFPNGWFFVAPNGGWEYSGFLTLSALALALVGDGAYAIRATRA